jgi:hypothetical protein
MSVNIEQIKPETLTIIERQAKFFGLSVDEYLRSLLPKTEKELPLEAGDDEFEADMLAFAEGAENISNYNGTYLREDIYFN